MLLPLSSAPCALLSFQMRKIPRNHFGKHHKVDVDGVQCWLFHWMFNKFCFLECSNNIECSTCCVLAWIFNLFENIQPFGLPPLSNVRHAVPWHEQSKFFWGGMFNTFWMFNSFPNFDLMRKQLVSHTQILTCKPPRRNEIFVSTNSFSNLYLG